MNTAIYKSKQDTLIEVHGIKYEKIGSIKENLFNFLAN